MPVDRWLLDGSSPFGKKLLILRADLAEAPEIGGCCARCENKQRKN